MVQINGKTRLNIRWNQTSREICVIFATYRGQTVISWPLQAYFCLSDNARRAAFDSERKRTISCNMKIPSTGNDPSRTNVKIRKPDQETFSRSNNRVQRRMKELQSKLRDEATIIEKCVIANATASRREVLNASGTRSETPIFNPSGYHHDHHQYQGSYGYPHQTRTVHQKRLDDLRAAFKTGNVRIPSTATNGSPVFQCRSETTASFRTRCATSRNHWFLARVISSITSHEKNSSIIFRAEYGQFNSTINPFSTHTIWLIISHQSTHRSNKHS